MLELARYCDELYGIDIHRKEKEVSEVLAKFNLPARLFHADVTEMPFEDRFFDCIVSVSTVEYFGDIDAACREVKRILKQGGFFIVITPGYSRIVDFGLWALTSKKAKDEYSQRRETLVSKLMEHFTLCKRLEALFYLSPIICLYRGLKLRIPN